MVCAGTGALSVIIGPPMPPVLSSVSVLEPPSVQEDAPDARELNTRLPMVWALLRLMIVPLGLAAPAAPMVAVNPAPSAMTLLVQLAASSQLNVPAEVVIQVPLAAHPGTEHKPTTSAVKPVKSDLLKERPLMVCSSFVNCPPSSRRRSSRSRSTPLHQ